MRLFLHITETSHLSMRHTHTLSHWAAKHRKTAIGFIVLLETGNGYLGTLLGANTLDNLSAGVLQAGIIALLGGVIYIRLWYAGADFRPNGGYRPIRRLCLFALFLGNFLLFTISGGIGANRTRDVQPTGSVNGTDVTRSGLVLSDSLQSTATRSQVAPPRKAHRTIPLALLIFGSLVLLGAGLFLTLLLMVLGCELSCSGHGLGAVLITLLGLGVLGVLTLFWGRVWTNNLIRKTIPAERSRASRRYRRVWLATVLGLLAAQILVIA